MSVNKFNSEGYCDPTPYEALTNIEHVAKAARAYRPLVYICSPLAGNIKQNQKNARRYCRYAVDSGYIPLAPHIYFPQFMSDRNPRERDLAMFMDIVLLSKCSELLVFGETISKGMAMEISKAQHKGQTIRYFTADLKEVSA